MVDLHKLRALEDELWAQTATDEFIEDTLAEVRVAIRLLSLVTSDLDEQFDVRRGNRDGRGGVTLIHQEDDLDALEWATSHVWGLLRDLEGRLSHRLNARLSAEPAPSDLGKVV